MDLTESIAEQIPMVALMAAFAWALLTIVKQVLNHYQKVLDQTIQVLVDQMAVVKEKISNVEERIRDRFSGRGRGRDDDS